jgi:hypothetical protein
MMTGKTGLLIGLAALLLAVPRRVSGSAPGATDILSGGSLLPPLPPLPGVSPAPGTTPAPGGTVTTPGPSTGGTTPASPGVRGFTLSPQAQVKLGLTVTKEVTKWFLTPVDQTMELSPEAQAAWGDYKLGEQADYSEWLQGQTPPQEAADLIALDNQAALTSVETGEGLTGDAAAAIVDGTVEAVPLSMDTGMSLLGPALKALGIAGALTDMGFTIAGKLPDAEKAVISALDAAIIGAMFIPVYGWAVGLALGVVRAVIGIFGGSIFGTPALSHKQREALEAQRTASQGLNPWMQQVAAVMTPRELVPVLIWWGTGYCGGGSSVAVMTSLIGGLYIGSPGCYANNGHPYHEWPNAGAMTRDDMALALCKYGEAEARVSVQAGIAQYYLDDMNSAGIALLKKRMAAWAELVAQGATLDDLDALALEQRQTPHWNAVANFFGEATWHDLIGWHLQDLWTRYLVTSRNGSMQDFARKNGYPSWLAMRDAVMVPYDRVMTDVMAFDATLAIYDGKSVLMTALPTPVTPAQALTVRVGSLGDRLTLLEAACPAWLAAQQAAAAYAAANPPPATDYYNWGSSGGNGA